jgi:hypothetical protein
MLKERKKSKYQKSFLRALEKARNRKDHHISLPMNI